MKTNRSAQLFIHLIFVLITCLCLIPFLILFTSSITDEQSIIQHGYSLFPSKISMEAYQYLFRDSMKIVHAYGVSVLVTIIGTLVSLTIISLLAYPISRKDMPLRNLLSFFVFFTMLFNGGLVPTYLVYTHIFDIKNSLFALIIPSLLLNAFYVILMRTFFATSIPVPVIESAYMDGAGEFRIFYQIVLPLSLPVLATVGLFQTIAYWNDWFNGLIYITDSKYYSIQNLLNRILLDIQYLKNNANDSNQMEQAAALPSEGVRMAIAVMGVVPILLTYPFFQKYFVKGLTVGAVKG
ncbi:carbohydrate ABC transporter permease [Paenibacillus thalictri]|uniref:Carbohydrate ABC transporter permease n=1 Tax=Paenibacillus thalictri TaxID=2527873 RepID=A0A4Q9DSQ7_9BACL|nr:carbohydrate ABC transporter permease [Paenibacillus thalictri]TBL79899.1 carbohydrate ABC transporter permease [Paenibacillus thalictri]